MQQLIFGGQQLDDKKLVFDYNILEGSTVDLQLPFHTHTPLSYWTAGSMNINVETMTKKTFQIRVKGTDTIQNVKSRIQNVENLPPCMNSKAGSEHNF